MTRRARGKKVIERKTIRETRRRITRKWKAKGQGNSQGREIMVPVRRKMFKPRAEEVTPAVREAGNQVGWHWVRQSKDATGKTAKSVLKSGGPRGSRVLGEQAAEPVSLHGVRVKFWWKNAEATLSTR